MKKLAKKLLLLFISIQFVACEGSLEPHLYGVVDTGNAFNTPADLSAATVALYYELRQKGWGPYLFCDGSSFVMDEVSTEEWTTKWSWVAFLNGSWTDADQMVKGFYNWTAPLHLYDSENGRVSGNPVGERLVYCGGPGAQSLFHVRFISALWSYANDSGSRPGNQSGPGL